MFLAMNRFKIKVGNEELFETIWRERDSHLEKVYGFIEFSLMKGESNEEIVDLWFKDLSRNVLAEEGMDTTRGSVYINTTKISKDKSEVK